MAAGQSLTIAAGTSLYIYDQQMISVSGQLTVTGASVSFGKNNNGGPDGILVNSGGTLTATGSSFSRQGGGGENTHIEVATGGHLIASGGTFTLDNLYLNGGLVLNSGDLAGNVFATALTAPIADEPLVTNNQSFNAVYLTGSLNSGQSVSLDPIGTQTTSGQYYILPNGLTVASGQSLTIAATAPLP